MKLFVVVKTANHPALPEIQGIFSTAELAAKACREWTDIYFELTLDEELPRESVQVSTNYHPLSGLVQHPGDSRWIKDIA